MYVSLPRLSVELVRTFGTDAFSCRDAEEALGYSSLAKALGKLVQLTILETWKEGPARRYRINGKGTETRGT